jgi:uncharacterized protein (DUF58 family)
MRRRWLLLALGVTLFGVGVVELLEPGTVPVPAAGTLLTVFGGLTLLYAVALYIFSRWDRLGYAETPDVEIVRPTEVPGTDLESTLDGFPGPEDIYSDGFDSRRRQLEAAAVAVLTRLRGVDAEQAREQVATGDWTETARAAGYLAEELPEPERELSLRRLFATESARQRSRRRTVDAIAAAAGIETDNERDIDPELLDGSVESGTTDRSGSRERERTGHWADISLVVLVSVGVGLLLELPGVLLAGAIGLGYVAYARSTPLGAVDLSASRSVSNTDPDPGERVEVTVTVTNHGGFCPDLRIVDGVPESLGVTEGSPRYGTALRAGKSVTFSYTVEVTAGTHEFGPVLVLAHNLSASVERELELEAASTVQSVPSPRPVQSSVPLRRQPTRYAGDRPTNTGGEGIEFRSVREYRPGDSMTRIDWNRRARTGELTTLEFHRERATRVVILIDTRRSAFAGPDPDGPDAVARSVAGAQRLFPALLDDGHQVGIAAFGAGECYLAPDSGTAHRKRGRDLLASEPAFHVGGKHYSRPWYWIPQLRRKLPSDTQLLVLSPLLEAKTVRIVRQLEAYGYPVTVISPDPTATGTPSQRLMRVRRRLLTSALRSAGVPVLDWPASATLEEILTREVAAR